MGKRYIIIEDEQLAYDELKRMMGALRPDYELSGWATSVEQGIQLVKNVSADLMLIDIRLSDGDSFEIFRQVKSEIPVIFTTAYDDYALKAFKLHSIDYLLKPISEIDLESALCKFERMVYITPMSPQYTSLQTEYERHDNRKTRFLIQSGDHYGYIPSSEIAFFYSEDKYNYLHTFTNRRYIVDYTLDRLETLLDPSLFFRVSRGCIVNVNSIKKASKYFTGRLRLQLMPDCPASIMVPRNRVNEFFDWLDDKK